MTRMRQNEKEKNRKNKELFHARTKQPSAVPRRRNPFLIHTILYASRVNVRQRRGILTVLGLAAFSPPIFALQLAEVRF